MQNAGFQSSLRRTLLEALVIIALLLGAIFSIRGCAGPLSSAIVDRLPASVDSAIGKAAGEAVRAGSQTNGPTPEQVARVEGVFNELRSHLTQEEARVLVAPRISVIVDPTVNAFALPGGEVFVLTGLLDRTWDDDDQLRGVLAHEIGHSVRRHGVRSLVRNSIYGLALSFFLGDIDALTASLLAGASDLERLSYSRSMEEEADAFGINLLKRTGRDADGLARFLESLERQPVPEFLSTHPDSKERARAIRKFMK